MRFAPTPERDHVVVVGRLILMALIVALVVLLATTPSDAIRLSRRRSEAIVLGGSIALQIGATLASPPPAALVLITSSAAVVVTAMLLWELRLLRWSAWIAAVFAWNPAVVYECGVRGSAWGIVLLLVLVGQVIVVGINRRST